MTSHKDSSDLVSCYIVGKCTVKLKFNVIYFGINWLIKHYYLQTTSDTSYWLYSLLDIIEQGHMYCISTCRIFVHAPIYLGTCLFFLFFTES